ncbi:hypothetical protein JRI60_34490 [Archangium violaceum]|uniref:hypothetical protein n=1 Tax=Archangium violaceum TaxID=83451 RepID=UPI0019511D77|nr:hypothetical protein [Archangium violaceum]QRN94224.1 hypothetical protein JRI60_34490 [Archangium violaceum]
MRIKSFPKISLPNLKGPKAPTAKPDGVKPSPRPDINGNLPGKKPDVGPKFSPRPDINGNLPGKKPDVGPKFSPRPDINGNLPGKKPDVGPKFSPRPDINGNLPVQKPDVGPKFSPRPDINGNLPGKKPDFNLDGFTPGNGLNNLKPNRLGGLGDGLSAAGDVLGGVANGVAGLAGAGLEAASMLPGALGMMDPYALSGMAPELAGGPMMDPYAAGALPPELAAGPMMDPYAAGALPQQLAAGPVMDPYAAGALPQQLAAGPVMDPYAAGGLPQQLSGLTPPTDLQHSDLGNILGSVAHALDTATQALAAVKDLVGQGAATVAQPLQKKLAEKLPTELAAVVAPSQDAQAGIQEV